MLQFLTQAFRGRHYLLLLRFAQFFELLVADDFTVADRREYVAGRRRHHPDALTRRQFIQRLPNLARFFLRILLDGFDLAAVVIGLERGGNGNSHLFDKGLHVASKFRAASRRKAERPRAIRVREVVYVAPVVRHWLRTGLLRQKVPGKSVPVAAGGPHDEDVVALALRLHPETYCVGRALLSHAVGGLLEFIAVLEFEPGEGPRLVEFADRDLE